MSVVGLRFGGRLTCLGLRRPFGKGEGVSPFFLEMLWLPRRCLRVSLLCLLWGWDVRGFPLLIDFSCFSR